MLKAIAYIVAVILISKLIRKVLRFFSNKEYSVEGGYLSGKHDAAAYTARTEAIKAKTEARRALDDLTHDDYAHEMAQLERERLLEETEFKKAVAQFYNQWQHEEQEANFQMRSTNIRAATDARLDLGTYNVNAGEVFKERGLAQSRVEEQRQLKQIELDAELKSQLQTIQAILEYQNIDYNRFDSIKDRVFDLIDEEEQIDASHATALVKGQKLEINRKAKQMYLGVLHGIENRLLEARDETDVSGIETLLTDARRPSPSTGATFEDAVSALVTGNRRPASSP